MLTQKDFIRKCYDRYKALGLETENKDDGNWEKAHYPLPQPEGKRWVWLLQQDHFVQGVLQSEEVGRCCFWSGDVKPFLKDHWCDEWFEIFDLYEKWQTIQASENGRNSVENGTGMFGRTPEKHSADSQKGGKTNAENGTGFFGMSDSDKFAAMSKGGRTNVENGTGLYGMSEEEKSKAGSKGGKIGGKTLNSLTYISSASGFVSHPGAVTQHNKRIGQSKDAKARVPDEIADKMERVGNMAQMNLKQLAAAHLINSENYRIYSLYVGQKFHGTQQVVSSS